MMFTLEAIPFWTAIAAVAASLSALIAATYTIMTFRLVRLQSEPKVIVYVKHDLERPSILTIMIENIGRDIAYDVTFRASKAIPAKAFGITVEEARPADIMDDGPLIEGIPSLGPGDFREITWGQFGGLSKAIGDKPILLDYNYSSGKRKITGHAKLEARSYLGTDASEKPIVIIARSLREISGSTSSIASQLKSFTKSPTRIPPNPAFRKVWMKSLKLKA
jgi:hypothetical protein